jgi:hypothetical protein
LTSMVGRPPTREATGVGRRLSWIGVAVAKPEGGPKRCSSMRRLTLPIVLLQLAEGQHPTTST